jgi:hypothetical protein
MEENPYKAPREWQAQTATEGKWPRRLRRWSHAQPLALFYLFLLAVSLLIAILAPVLH